MEVFLKKFIIAFVIAMVVGAGSAYALFDWSHQKTPVEFYKGHTHMGDETVGAPAHSGGTNAMGCHNASVPYHCH